MKPGFKFLYFTIEVNLLLWLAMLGGILSEEKTAASGIAWAGLAFAALFQHWAYYHLRSSCLPLRDSSAS